MKIDFKDSLGQRLIFFINEDGKYHGLLTRLFSNGNQLLK